MGSWSFNDSRTGGAVIVRRYGTKMHSVEPNFDAHAMNEIGFRRDNDWSLPVEEFQEAWEKVETHELTANAEGEVQNVAEDELLKSLQAQLAAVAAAAGDGVVVIESETGTDYPKTRHTQRTQVVDGANRLYFRFTVEPPLRVAVYRAR
jgi:hypothetical protein